MKLGHLTILSQIQMKFTFKKMCSQKFTYNFWGHILIANGESLFSILSIFVFDIFPKILISQICDYVFITQFIIALVIHHSPSLAKKLSIFIQYQLVWKTAALVSKILQSTTCRKTRFSVSKCHRSNGS